MNSNVDYYDDDVSTVVNSQSFNTTKLMTSYVRITRQSHLVVVIVANYHSVKQIITKDDDDDEVFNESLNHPSSADIYCGANLLHDKAFSP